MCADHYPLGRGCNLCCGDQSLHWILVGASSLLFGCHSPVRGRVCSPVVGIEALRSGSKLQCEVGRTGGLPLLKESLSIPLQELSTRKCALCCHLSPVVCTNKIHCFWPCPWTLLSRGHTGNQPRCPKETALTKLSACLLKSDTQTCHGS